MKYRSTFKLVVAACLIFSATLSIESFAQEGTEKTYVAEDTVVVIADRVTRIPTTGSVAAKMTIPLQQTPASVGVVTNALIENQDGVVLVDALKNVSGVNVQSGFGVFDYFIIRGYESLTNGLVLIDGAAEPEVTFYNLYNLERIEVLKGPSASLYGGNPLSGTVNLVRKQPIFKNFLHVNGSFGRFKSYRGTLDFGLANLNSGVAFRFNSLWQDSENYRDDKSNDNISVNPALTWRLDDKTMLNVNLEYVDNSYQPDAGVPLFNNQMPNVPRTRSYQSPFDLSDQKILRGRIDFERRMSRALTLRDKMYYTDLDWKSDGTLFFGTFPDGQGGMLVARALTTLDDRQKMFGNQFEGLFNFTTGTLKHQLLGGFEVSRLGDKFTFGFAQLPLISLFNPLETATANAITRVTTMQADGRSISYAPYVLDHVSFSEKLQVLLGGRYDVIDFQDERTLFNNGFAIPSPTDRTYKKFSPMAGLTFSPASSISFYANAGQAFAPPSSQQIGELKAEESTQVEFGVKTSWLEGKFNVSFAAYQLDKENLAIADANQITYHTGEQRSRGIEIDVAAQPARNWQAFIVYAYTDAELSQFIEEIQLPTGGTLQADRSGNTPSFAPEHILNLWSNKEFKNGLGIGAGARYISSQFIDEDNVYESDGYATIDGMVYYSIGNWRWSLNFKNITDTEYETRGFGSASVIPGNPFAVYGAVEFKL
jgi:TonB-dependent siderophore receptor